MRATAFILFLTSFCLQAADVKPKASPGFVLRSPVVANGGALPREFTGDGDGVSPPLEWSGVPAGTKSFALIMHHFPHEGEAAKWYWTVYNIPAETKSLAKATKGIGVFGSNCINRSQGYAPPHSKGPGVKTYTLTLYALSSAPDLKFSPAQVNRDVLLAAMKDRTLGSAELSFTYDRTGLTTKEGGKDAPPEPTKEPRRQPH